MPVDLPSYLATRYLTADVKPSKKRKRKHASSSGLLIQDDDADDPSGWGSTKPADPDDNDDSDGFPATAVAGTSAEFRRAKKSNWASIAGPGADEEAAGADAVIAAAAAETAAAARAADDEGAPVVEGGGEEAPVRMADGTHAGLQSAKAVSAQLARRRKEERDAYERERKERKAKGLGDGGEEEAVYRDATGRRIDLSLRREEARRAALEAEEKERKAKEALKGDVQIEMAKQRREQLDDAALMPLARRADDEEMNRELKEQERWNDPMAQFLTEKKTGGGGNGKKKGKGRPVYSGAAPPNRYGIRPGYRWDGVDRGNGFEAERFKAINRRERNKGLEYSWQMDE